MAEGFGRVLEELIISFDLECFVLIVNAAAEFISWRAGVIGPAGQPDPAKERLIKWYRN